MNRFLAVLCLALGLVFAAQTAFAAAPNTAPGGEQAHGTHDLGHVNWMNGFLGESETAHPASPWQPTLFRPKGTPPPMAAMFINTAILFYLIGRYGAPKMSQALKKRKLTIMHGMDEAARMKDDAAKRLAEYEEKLARIDEEIERVKREMREAGEAERVRFLAEAKEKRLRMERDAQLLIEQELKAARELLLRETVQVAVASAQELLSRQVSTADHQRLADEYVKNLGTALGERQ